MKIAIDVVIDRDYQGKTLKGSIMRHRDLLALIGDHSQHTPADLDGRGRELRAADLIESGPRGVHAPHVTPVETARIIIAVAGSKKAIEAADAVKTFWSLALIADGGPDKAKTFGAALSAIFRDEDLANQVREVRLGLPGKSLKLLDGAFAAISWRTTDKTALYRSGAGHADQIFKHMGSMRMGSESYIGGELVAYIAGKIGERSDA